MSENPQSHLELDAAYDAVFPCDLCEFVAHGPGELEAHQRDVHTVPAASVGGVSPNTVGAEPYRRKR